ncbi:MAG: flagellin [Methanomicrobiales archaeon]|jgi:flagellar protein FlaG|nr:flagellin [Methanomicrobiales archaeon]
MSSETIVTAIFLITAIVAAGVLASQVLPAVFSVSGTASSTAHQMDVQISTDITIVNTYANTSSYAQVWIRNTGDERLSTNELDGSIIFVGAPGDFEMTTKNDLSSDGWTYEIIGDGNAYLDPGEMLHVTVLSDKIPGTIGDVVTFQFVLPNGVRRSEEFTVS